MKKVVLIFLSLYFAIVFLMPKVNLYYTLKQFAQQEKVTIVQKSVSDRWFDLKITDADLFYDGINSAHIDTLKILPWIFYNKIVALDIHSGKDIKKMFDFKADSVDVVLSIINPFVAKIDASGNFGKVYGTFNLKSGKLKLICEPTSKFKNSQAFREVFRKTQEGYVHESNL